ncbi:MULTISPECIES: class I SAM-dependent methyltransferase [Stenotrophomonas]|uniref:class I SAM-dependent methyltransferase n=1 Tax=Stenotrophomonas TaxID=40323 RepID=UPI001F2ED599|nr:MULTISPECIES: class I SAM-dependent methyltransferase [Stenotrophomonas maltophilia group]MCF3526844.1 class I SAM-dependent methyltransferase [Stenotrophomonas maltophilia]MCF3554116.1 class I SAM-dependent methyltransferase [Stenotrophomonas maltophilia]MCU1054886.1 class I SAM-dependent methyltransferase [Stenotrophomonas maltophilia]
MIDFQLSPNMLMMPRKLPHSAWLGHIPFASWLVETVRPKSIVELGTHNGASFLAFCQAVETQHVSARVFAVDTWEGDEHAGFYGDEVYAELRDYQQRHYAGISEMMRMRFDQALEYFAEGSVDILHVDGLHTYEAVREDFETWRSKLSRRAVVLFHDSCVRERGFGVWQYWSEICSQFPSFEFTHTHGLGVLLVGEEQPQELLRLAEAARNGQFATINQFFDALGRNIKNVEEIERVNQGLAAAHGEIGRLNNEVARLNGEEARLRALLDKNSDVTEEHYAVVESQLPALAQGLSMLERRVIEGMNETRQALDDSRELSVANVVASVIPRLDEQDRKLTLLARPWWRRMLGR